jgi:hypothetical protein
MLRNPLITSNLRLRQVAIIPAALLKVPEGMGVEEALRRTKPRHSLAEILL